jgi:hypothetical protein
MFFNHRYAGAAEVSDSQKVEWLTTGDARDEVSYHTVPEDIDGDRIG